MSGFIAQANRDQQAVDPILLQTLTDFLAFRGPDRQALWVGADGDRPGPAGLGHALLATTYESAQERQPTTFDDQVWIVSDARVDGRRELIRQLRESGRDVDDAAPDVELILHTYHVWSEACVAHLIGDFAFVIWDAGAQRLFAACDQFGVTPFYYAEVQSGLVCSNTLACLRRHPEVPPERDEQAIGDTLIFGASLDPAATLFAGIRRLPPAHKLSWSAGRLRIERYWRLPEYDRCLDLARPEEYTEQFLALFRQAVVDRLRTDHPGILMSGGLDSTAIAAVAAEAVRSRGAGDLQAYTWVYDWLFPDDERQYAGLAGQFIGIPVHYISGEAALTPPETARLAAPPAVPVAFAHEQDGLSHLRQHAAHGRVMLAGTGGDIALLQESSYWLKRLASGQGRGLWSDIQQHRRVFGRRPPLYVRDLARRYFRRPKWVPPYPRWFDPDFAARWDLPGRLDSFVKNYQIRYTRARIAAPTWVLSFTRSDPGHTGIPVEVRHPFFDLRLLDFLFRVPGVPWFFDKYLLRSAMRGLLPEAVRLRRKQTLASWPRHALALREGGPAPWMERLAEGPELQGFVDRAAFLKALRAPEQSTAVDYQLVVGALSLADLLRQEAQFDQAYHSQPAGHSCPPTALIKGEGP